VGVPRPPQAHITDVVFTRFLGAVVSLEGFQDPSIFRVASHVIYVSLLGTGRALNARCGAGLRARAGSGTAGTGVRPCSAPAPRDVVRAVLVGLRDGDCEAALRFAGEASEVQGRGWTVVRR
jgi:hypothetical protein